MRPTTSLRRTLIGGGLAALLCAAAAQAYFIHLKGPLHEGMTRVSEACAADAAWSPGTRCDVSGFEAAVEDGDFTASQKSVRWPDDPTGALVTSGIVMFSLDMLRGCERRLDRIDGDRSRRAELGLLCHSHYGSLQFLHAMASAPDDAPSQTQAELLDWARLNFRVASGALDTSVNYCDYFSDPSSGLEAIATPMLEVVSDRWCTDRPKKFLGLFRTGDVTRAWSVGTLYNLDCRNPFNPRTCTETLGSGAAERARLRAVGSMLHMIQDSYSMSHARRPMNAGDALTDYPAEVRCRPIRIFEDYSEQTANDVPHSDADAFPVFRCDASDAVDDPITAGARILDFIEKAGGASDVAALEDEMIDYLRTRVLVLEAG